MIFGKFSHDLPWGSDCHLVRVSIHAVGMDGHLIIDRLLFWLLGLRIVSYVILFLLRRSKAYKSHIHPLESHIGVHSSRKLSIAISTFGQHGNKNTCLKVIHVTVGLYICSLTVY